ncbi:hypothetical protein [Neptunomonas marina]|uniref:Uncharacterized protein n=1 Tax=Neptunomonas marina TaxID=1815562 RepID=A0A437Q4B8_9GAMM|nr:hypothetical protein [Neptunomonas marina]RVU29321.1 hypothetical protein EOE65_17000 [Neptunomonas marina]
MKRPLPLFNWKSVYYRINEGAFKALLGIENRYRSQAFKVVFFGVVHSFACLITTEIVLASELFTLVLV